MKHTVVDEMQPVGVVVLEKWVNHLVDYIDHFVVAGDNCYELAQEVAVKKGWESHEVTHWLDLTYFHRHRTLT